MSHGLGHVESFGVWMSDKTDASGGCYCGSECRMPASIKPEDSAAWHRTMLATMATEDPNYWRDLRGLPPDSEEWWGNVEANDDDDDGEVF